MRIRIGVIGLGEHWERRHQPALRALSDRLEIRAICSEVALKASQVARSFDAIAVDGYRALLARSDIDAVLLLQPQWYGALPILAACDLGKDVYCATAIETSVDEARRLRDRVEQAGITFMCEFPRRMAPATVRLKELIATSLGQPRLLFCHRRLTTQQGNGGRPGRRFPSAKSELLEIVDWCRYVVGEEPTGVTGILHNVWNDSDPHDYRMMSLDFTRPNVPGGALAQISCGHYLPETWPEAITFRPPAALNVVCERGTAFIDLPSTLVWFDEAGRHIESLDSERPVGELLLSCFYRSVTSLVRKVSDLDDAYRALAIVSTAERSFRSGQRETLEDL